MRRTLILAVGVVLIATVAVVVWPKSAPSRTKAAATGTAKVTKRDLAVTEDVTGDLGYADPRDLSAHRAGVVTALAAAGSTVKPGKTLYAIDTEPTVLLTGKVPAYRALNVGSSDGDDVRQLEQSLKDLGYGAGLTVDRHFSSATADAVRDWERDLGRDDPDGTVELGDVVFAPGPLRVAGQSVSAGTQVQAVTTVLSVTGTGKVADVDLDVEKSDLVAPKDKVAVSLPDGKETTGTVASVGTDRKENATDPNADPTVALVVTLTRPKDATGFDSGPVTVSITQSRDEGVLAVPVTALLALAEGGYAVQVVDPAQPAGYRLIGVQTGTITDDYAGISGPGVTAGLEVVVPA
jgi:peptidoglycan hydrolase-like protein with peptidoglycan-binding domain